MLGTRPVVDMMFSDFMPLAMDHIVNHAAKMRYMYGGKISVPMVIRTFCGAGTSLGCSHSQSFEAWFTHVPGLKVVMPSTTSDAKGLMTTAILDDDPVLFIEHRLLYSMTGSTPNGEFAIPFGKADIKREGRDVTIVATAMMVQKSLEAANDLAKEDIEVEVIDPRTLNPLDVDLIVTSVKKTSRLIIVHEANQTCGFGSEIAAIVAKHAFEYLDAPIERICAPDTPIPFSPALEKHYIPNKQDIIQRIKEMF
jgi:pyruvate dehydrogenase E1 component beta subunit